MLPKLCPFALMPSQSTTEYWNKTVKIKSYFYSASVVETWTNCMPTREEKVLGLNVKRSTK